MDSFRGHRSGHYRRRRTSRRRRSRSRFYNPFLDSSEPLLDEKVDSIVDLTAVGLGRFIPRIARVAQRTQPNIIIATGIYTYRVRALFLSFARAVTRNVDIMTEMFVGDIEKGVGDTGLRAGILKYATEQHGVTKDVE